MPRHAGTRTSRMRTTRSRFCSPRCAREPEPGSILEKVVISVLWGGMSGRLFTEVREKSGLCYSFSAGTRAGNFSGRWSVCRDRAGPGTAIAGVLVAELGRVDPAAGKITQNEFDRECGDEVAAGFQRGVDGGACGGAGGGHAPAGATWSLDEIARESMR